jgi:hypothetical protein
VHLSGLDVEAFPQTSLMTVIESVLSWVLLPHTRITAVEGEVGEVLRSHVDRAGSCGGGSALQERREGRRGRIYV